MRERWYDNYLKVYGKAYDGAAYVELAASIREKIARLQSPHPLVTVSVIGYNEEKHLLACLWALSEMKTRYPIEIIGVDNDSQDKTAEIFQATGVPYFVEKHHSCGSARLCGLRHARGKYHINIDSDTLYPPSYVDCMADVLERDPKVVGVNGTWGYFPTPHTPVWQLWMYEKMRNVYLRMQAIRRPELSVRGLVFAYRTKEALEVGIRTHIIRGEDGALALGLKNYGKILFLYNAEVRAITGYGTIGMSLWRRFLVRVGQIVGKFHLFFTSSKEYKDQESNLIDKNRNR